MRNVVFGGLGQNQAIQSPDPCGGTVPSAQALVLTLLLNSNDDPAYTKKAEAWEAEVFLKEIQAAEERLKNDLQTPMTLHYLSERSIQDSLSTETTQNTWVVLVSYLCMLIYISFALGQFIHPPPFHSPTYLPIHPINLPFDPPTHPPTHLPTYDRPMSRPSPFPLPPRSPRHHHRRLLPCVLLGPLCLPR